MTTPDAGTGTAVPDDGAEPTADARRDAQASVEKATALSPNLPGPLIQPDPTAAAFFDLDNTVIQGASLFHLARGLYKRGFFPTRAILKGVWLQAYFRIVGRENDNHMQQARDSALSFIAGRTVQEVAQAGEEIYEESILPKIWPGTRALVQTHLDVGQQVWVVTAAPIELASIIAARLGLTGALATVPETIDGVYTGRLKGELLHGSAKAEAVRGLAAENGLDLARCFAYSDSYNDLPMLSLVGHPCAVNPDRRLAQHAQELDWQIREFRTHRRAVRLGLLGAGATGVAAGALAAGFGVRRIFKHD
ncbi:HAD family hydrolase [Microlunatus elymi]|uniref:HAD family hydrolase n=1 Tax=Microlunatus elymi TaxID=2596828 RepID=A0A516Q4E8_9ACTN|nr:HAD family hydrolase [Microlunatus elymi]QDP98284.1 HAD family hydrolase [Microlunatus elymi]